MCTIGQRIRLRGFEGYKAGLDTRTDSTGTHAVAATYRGAEVTFHVSTMLPFTPNNRQQLLRKRHIGNDIVTIVFQVSYIRLRDAGIDRPTHTLCDTRALFGIIGTWCVTVQPAKNTLAISTRFHRGQSGRPMFRQHSVQGSRFEEQRSTDFRATSSSGCHLHQGKSVRRLYLGESDQRGKCRAQVANDITRKVAR